MVEDGVLRYQSRLPEDDVRLLEDVGDSGNIFTLGCMYWNRVNQYMTMLGSVTDAQIFSRILEEKEMIGYTTCSKKVINHMYYLHYHEYLIDSAYWRSP